VALICDTGPLFAAMNDLDDDHRACADLLEETPEQLLVPGPVLVELDWLASARLGPASFAAFLAEVEQGQITIVDLASTDYIRVRELLIGYSDLGLGFVDAAVLAVVERLNEKKLATLDHRHFRAVRQRHVDALDLLPA
jgi:predicted nucleic acid-binding protein